MTRSHVSYRSDEHCAPIRTCLVSGVSSADSGIGSTGEGQGSRVNMRCRVKHLNTQDQSGPNHLIFLIVLSIPHTRKLYSKATRPGDLYSSQHVSIRRNDLAAG